MPLRPETAGADLHEPSPEKPEPHPSGCSRPSSPPPTPGASLRSMKALLVEDSPAAARLIVEMLKEWPDQPLDIHQTARLDSALAQLRREPFAVVLLDLGLPDSQGM